MWCRGEKTRCVIWSGLVVGVIFLLLIFTMVPPHALVDPVTVVIPSGFSVDKSATLLQEAGVIRSSRVFSLSVRILGKHVKAGAYSFEHAEPLPVVLYRLVVGDYQLGAITFTVPEGFTVGQVAELCMSKISGCVREEFIAESQGLEGYLFPDTYQFFAGDSAKKVLEEMHKNFDAKIASVTPEIVTSGHPLSEIITMASLLEEEGKDEQDRRIISGILWSRLAHGMPLQVDATFIAINGKTSGELTRSDLTIDSPYNTYRYKGLPPGPIVSPGMESILAALNPISTKYQYYLTGTDGVFHYARTYEEHLANRAKYLDTVP